MRRDSFVFSCIIQTLKPVAGSFNLHTKMSILVVFEYILRNIIRTLHFLKGSMTIKIFDSFSMFVYCVCIILKSIFLMSP